VFGPAVDAVRRRQWHRFWLGAAASLIVIVLGCAYRTPAGHAFIEAYAITRPGSGWATVALRLPLSMFAPAALLPFWFAIVQVGVVYGLAQAILGWRRTVLVAVVGHVLATCSAHLWILLGPPLGVSHRYDTFGDAGPSVAVVTVIAYLAVVRGASWLVGLLVAYDVIEIAVFNGLSQREHLVGVLAGATCAGVGRLAGWARAFHRDEIVLYRYHVASRLAPMITAETVTRALDRIAAHYVFPERAAEMAEAIRQHLDDGRYDQLTGAELCAAVTADLQAVWADPHLRLIWHEQARPAWDRADDDAGEVANRREKYRLNSEGVHRVERLAGNVGLIELRGVGDPEWASPAYAAAMRLVTHTYALILDMRRNVGGSPDGVALFCSYLFPTEPVHLNDVYDGTTGRTRQFWTSPHLPAPRYLDRPVFVLTSAQTFSAGEEICYNLRSQGRAMLIGETTRGGAHPSDTYQVGPQVDVRIPCARSINPITGTNWEGVGVIPDVPASAEKALDIAYADALRHVLTSTADATGGHELAVRAEAESALADQGSSPASAA
jgi:hypothetical protein